METDSSARARSERLVIRSRTRADQGGKCCFYLEDWRNKAEPAGSRGWAEEFRWSPRLDLTFRGPIPGNRHKSKFQKECKLLSKIPPEISCSEVMLGQKSEELRLASTLPGRTVRRPGNVAGAGRAPQALPRSRGRSRTSVRLR